MNPRILSLPCFVLPLLAFGCGPAKDDTAGEGPGISGVEAVVSDVIGTVVTLRYTTDAPARGRVRFGVAGTLDRETPLEVEAGTEHEVHLLGLPPETAISYEIEAEDEAGGHSIAEGDVTTSYLTNDLPSLTLTGEGHDLFTVTTLLGAITGPAILDPQGRIVWFYPDERGLQIFRARLSVDGRSLLYNAAQVSGGPSEDSAIVRVALDGSSVEALPVSLLAHDFVEFEDGTIAAIVVEWRDFEGEPLMGDKIVEISPDGTSRTVWSTWDCFEPAVDVGDDQENGWTFANALDYDPVEDAFLLSLRNFSTIVRIDRASGTCPWAFGSAGATFAPAAGSSRFLHEHQFDLRDDRLLVFDNAGAGGLVSRVLEYDFDPGTGRAEEVWSYQNDPPIFTFVLGDVLRLDDGDTIIDWATGAQIDRVGPSGELKWRVSANIGFAFGFFEAEEDLYR